MQNYREKTGFLTAFDKIQIYYHYWEVDNPGGIVIIAHGLGEHSGRYINLIQSMEKDSISFYALDHRGHGKSEGKRGHIDLFSDYIEDLRILFKMACKENQGVPIILLGHSLGGVIACKYALTYPEDISGLILSSAGLIPLAPALKKRLAEIFVKIAPSVAMSSGLNSSDLSHDQSVVNAYINDSLVHDRVTSRWFIEFLQAGTECMGRAGEITMPLLIIHGSDDKIVDFHGSQQFMANASAKDKELLIFKGLYHETMNETPEEREKVIAALRNWIIKRLGGQQISRNLVRK